MFMIGIRFPLISNNNIRHKKWQTGNAYSPTCCCCCCGAEWWYGDTVCRWVTYLQGVAVGASVNTLAAVAVERSVIYVYSTCNVISFCCFWWVIITYFTKWVHFILSIVNPYKVPICSLHQSTIGRLSIFLWVFWFSFLPFIVPNTTCLISMSTCIRYMWPEKLFYLYQFLHDVDVYTYYLLHNYWCVRPSRLQFIFSFYD